MHPAPETPQTDRELLLKIYQILVGPDGQSGLCSDIQKHGDRISALENWRWYILGGISIITLVLVAFGRYLDLT
jgi:hypothetical protein